MASNGKEIVDVKGLEAALAGDIAKTKKSRRNTVIGAAVLAIVAIAYLTWLYTALRTLVKEDALAGDVGQKMHESIPTVKGLLARAMVEFIPAAVDQVAQVAIERMPEARESVEDLTVRTMDAAVADLDTRLDALLQEQMIAYEDAIHRQLKQFEKAKDRQEFEKKFKAQIAELYRTSARESVKVFHDQLTAFDAELVVLCDAKPENLTVPQRERRDLVLCMTAYLESLFAEQGSQLVDYVNLLFLQPKEKATVPDTSEAIPRPTKLKKAEPAAPQKTK